jgi:CO/xanthine dehydrogenase Mo-binding subunit
MTTNAPVVGQSVRRVEGPEKVTGRARYGMDAFEHNALWCRILRSPFPRARIVNIDGSAAKALPGVRAVLTGEDVKGMRTGSMWKDEPLLAWDEVRLVGDKVAAVAADDEDIALHALSLIEVEYEELPALTDAVEAAKPGAPVLHPDFNEYVGVTPMDTPGNVYLRLHHEKGDIAAGLADADVVVESTYKTPLQHQAYLEPHACLVDAQPDGSMQIWVSSQSPSGVQNEIARLLDLEPNKVIVNFSYIGGSFGGKADGTGVALCALMSRETGRPVKFVMDYDEEFQNMAMRHPATMRIKAGAKRDGTITAWEAEIHLAGGAYAAYAPVPMGLQGIMEIVGPYRIENVRIDSAQVYTNTSPCSFARAPGHVQSIFAGESHMDTLAKAIGMSPLDFRLQNIVHDGDDLPNGHHFQDLRAEETIRAAVEASEYESPQATNIGRGMAVGSHSQIGGDAHVRVTVHDDGRIEAGLPTFDPGVGTHTTIAQIVAQELDVPVERVHVIGWSTDNGPFDFGVGGSRGARMYSTAGYAAAQDTKGNLKRLAAEFLGWDEEGITFQSGNLVNAADDERVPLEQIANRAGTPVIGENSSIEGFDSPWTSFATHIAEVSVDPETSEVELLRYTAVHETGRILNPVGFHGQVEGGIVQAIGGSLMEGLFYDESGRVINPSFADMKIPASPDIPELKTVILESDAGHGPYKVRGIGEHSNIMAAAAIANAVANASAGARVTELPITTEKVYRGREATA